MRRHGSLIAIASVVAGLACAPAAGAASVTEGTVTLLKGSTLIVTFPDGTTHTQPVRGTFRGTVPSRARRAPFRIALEVSNAYAAFGPDAPLCGGGRSVIPWRQGLLLAPQLRGGAGGHRAVAVAGGDLVPGGGGEVHGAAMHGGGPALRCA